MKTFIKHIVLIIALATVSTLNAKTDTILESKVKAAYIYNFSQFAQWPQRDAGKIRICVVGDKMVGDLLQQLIIKRSETSNFEIVVSDNINNFTSCHLLYISHVNPHIKEILKKNGIHDVLTVSDAKTFAHKGGMIGLFIEDGKMLFEINIKKTNTANIKVSSKLLSLARVIKE